MSSTIQREFPLLKGKNIDALPEDLFIPPNALELILEEFSGPMDLLLYLINKKWQLSSGVYILAIFTKAFIFVFFLSTIFYIYRAEISSRKKIWTICSYGVAVLIILVIFSFGDSIYNDIIVISDSEFFLALNTLGYTLRYDIFIILSLLPLTVGLFLTSRRGILQADSILVLILTSLLAGPFISMLTEFYFVLPYRFLPLIVFVAIGIGVFFSKRD